MKNASQVRHRLLEKMILEELDRSDLQAEIERTLDSCSQILDHFSESPLSSVQLSNRQRKKLYSALHSTISHIDYLIEEIRKQPMDDNCDDVPSMSINWPDRQRILELERRKLQQVFEGL